MTFEDIIELAAFVALVVLTVLPFILIALDLFTKDDPAIYKDPKVFKRKLRVVRGGKLDDDGGTK
jgi:hypothetical protein